MRASLRRLWRRVRRPRATVVVHPRYASRFPSVPNDPLRAERILAFLLEQGLVLGSWVEIPEPAWMKTIDAIHENRYLDSLHDPSTLTSILGVETTPDQTDRIVEFQRIQTGGTLKATRHARRRGLGINLGGGFHHAHRAQGGGFCLFNDIAVAIADERRRGFFDPVLVIDLDLHDGDGTRSIFADDPSVHTLSIHGRDWDRRPARESTSIELGPGVEDAGYLAAVRHTIPPLVERFRPGLVFALLGADPAATDELGDWRITPEGMCARDLFVLRLLREEHGLPVVVLLAGGYGDEAWRVTARSLSAWFRFSRRPIEPPSSSEMTFRRYRWLSSVLDPEELSGRDGSDPFSFSEEDIQLPGWGMRRETRLLGYYTRHGVELTLERTGFFDRLRDLGYDHPTVEFDLDDPAGHTVRVFGDDERRQVVVELRVRRDRAAHPEMELLAVEWLLLQHPRGRFTSARPQLPGQEHPGLGELRETTALLAMACRRLHLDGILFVPSQLHVAWPGTDYVVFLEPEIQARFEGLERVLGGLPFAEASRALQEGRVVDAEGRSVGWKPEPMLFPVSHRSEDWAARLREDASRITTDFRLLPASPNGPRGKDSP